MELLSDVSCGDWLLDRVGDWARVGGVAGTGFEAYARILHPVPASLVDLTVMDEWGMHPVLEEEMWPWAEVAGRQGLTMHPLVEWERLADVHEGVDFDDGWQVGQTEEGYLDLNLLATLSGHLAGATVAPDELVAAIWVGWGHLSERGAARYVESGSGISGMLARRLAKRSADADQRALGAPAVRRAVKNGPYLKWPGREMLLFATSSGELADPLWSEQAGIGVEDGMPGISPQLIWPADHTWVVASEIDWDSTIVAGSRSLVDAVLADARFEAFEVAHDADMVAGDLINSPRGG